MKYKFTRVDCSIGGKRAARQAGGECPRCGKKFKNHAALAGHLGLHGFADRFADGDIQKGRVLLAITGAAASDPVPENGAYAAGHAILKMVGWNGYK